MARHDLSLHQTHKKSLFFAACCCAAVLQAFGHESHVAAQDVASRTIAYDTVSIHPCKTGEGMAISTHPDRFSARCTTLWGLIFNAYDVRPNYPISGLPGWATSETFDVEATMDDNTFAVLQALPREQQEEQRQRMLRVILADRFKLTIRHEKKEQPIYALVIAKGGAKLTPGEETKGAGIAWGRGLVDARAATIARFASILSDVTGREVADKTGLAGKYDIKLTWTPDELQGTVDAGPTLFAAIEEQLGLKLESKRGSVDTIVVDHVEKPTEN